MPEPILVAEGVRKIYRSGGTDVCALKGLDLEVQPGEFLAVMGPSGSGKTTLLNCLSGLDDIDAGRVIVDGHSIHELSDAKRTRHRAETMGFIFQAFNLIPVFTATENVELPLLLARVPEADARRRARRRSRGSASGTGSTGGRPSFPAASSSASRSRALWPPAAAHLGRRADREPGLREGRRGHGPAAGLHAEGLTLVLVTHDPTVAARADRLITVKDGELVGDERLSSHERRRRSRRSCHDRRLDRPRRGALAAVPPDPRPPAGVAPARVS